MEKISIIVPIYNSSLYLKRCLDSIINQTYENLEIILIDDCSDDDSFKICESYLKKDDRIILFSNKKNRGVSYSRNRALASSTGEYIAFIDSDDSIEPDYIEFLYNLIIEDDYDVSVCGHKNIKRATKKILNQPEALKHLFLDDNFSLGVWGKIYKKDLFNKIEFKDTLYEDIYVSGCIFLKANNTVYCDEKKYNYLIRKESLTYSHYTEKDKDRITESYSLMEKVIKKHPTLTKEAKIFYLNSLIATCNKQMLNNLYNTLEIKKTKEYIKGNLFTIFLVKYSLLKKLQYLLFLFNVKIYIKIYKKIKKSVLVN